MDKKYKADLDPDIASSLRRVVNDDVNISLKASKAVKYGKKPFPSWNRICVIMDRIEDTADHLNNLVLTPRDDNRCAFDFLDLINHASVLTECIYEMARLYDIDMAEYESSCEVFHQPGFDRKGSDTQYMKYLRSLCSAHPIETKQHRSYLTGSFECCPFVAWQNSFSMERRPCDLYALIYTTQTGNHYKTIPIHLSQIFQYIESQYGLIETVIIPGIEAYKERYREEFRNKPMKAEEEFDSYIDYLCYLREEENKRFGDDGLYIYEDAMNYCILDFHDARNRELLSKYLNAIKFAMRFQHSCLQNMSFEGYENNGISFPESWLETTLLDCVMSPHSYSDEAREYGYFLSKVAEVRSDSYSDKYYARRMLDHARPFLDKYVNFDEAETDFERYALTQMALYADSLVCNNFLNRNIPNDLRFRLRLLNDAEWEELHRTEEAENEAAEIVIPDFLDL